VARPVCLLTSDWHLSPLVMKKLPNVKYDSYYALEQIVDKTLEYNVPLVAAGDLFDVDNPPAESVRYCSKQMRRLQDKGLKVYYVQGQHEYATTPWMGLFDNAVHMHCEKDGEFIGMDVNGISMLGMDIQKNGSQFAVDCARLNAKHASHKYDVFVTHQVWGDFVKKADDNIMLRRVQFARMVYTGDYHKFEVRNVSGMPCLSSGSTCIRATNEPPEKKIFVLYDDLSFVDIPINSRPFFQFSVKSTTDLDFIHNLSLEQLYASWPCRNLPEHIREPLVHVKYQTNLLRAHEVIRDKFGIAGWHLDMSPVDFNSIEIIAAAERQGMSSVVTVQDCLDSLAIDPESEMYKDAIRLYEASNVNDEIRNMREEHLEKGATNVA
jgi:hypothetical protein